MSGRKKYEMLLDNPIRIGEHTVYRIRALRDIGDDVKAGDLGGWIESERNLSQKGDCWVYAFMVPDLSHGFTISSLLQAGGIVLDEARVFEDAKFISGKARNKAKIFGKAIVSGRCVVADEANIYENATIKDHVYIGGQCNIHGYASIQDKIRLGGKVEVCDEVVLRGDADLCGQERFSGSMSITIDLFFDRVTKNR